MSRWSGRSGYEVMRRFTDVAWTASKSQSPLLESSPFNTHLVYTVGIQQRFWPVPPPQSRVLWQIPIGTRGVPKKQRLAKTGSSQHRFQKPLHLPDIANCSRDR